MAIHGWQFDEKTQAYSRRLSGSEVSLDTAHVAGGGLADSTLGVSFHSAFNEKAIVPLVREALGRLRFHAPLIAATIVGELGTRTWQYQCAPEASAVKAWAEETLRVRHNISAEDFEQKDQPKVPYANSSAASGVQYTCVDLLCHPVVAAHEGHEYTLVIHGGHAIWDARVIIDALHCIFTYMSEIEGNTYEANSVTRLDWGTEWTNLSPDVIQSTGGHREGWEAGTKRNQEHIERMLTDAKPLLGLQPQRQKTTDVGKIVRAKRVIPEDALSRIVALARRHGGTVTTVIEAAVALAVFHRNQKLVDGTDPNGDSITLDDSYVTFDIAVVALQRYMVPPFDARSRLGSSIAIVPLVLRAGEIQATHVNQPQLIRAMRFLKNQYDDWLANPYIPYLASFHVPPGGSSLSPVVTNLGVVERYLARDWQQKDGRVIANLSGMTISQRLVQMPRPVLDLWTICDELTIQWQSVDIWDLQYADEFLQDVVDLVLGLQGRCDET